MAKLNQVSVGVIGVATWGVVALALWASTPAKLKPAGVTLWFLVLFLALSCVLALLLDLGKRLFGPKKPKGRQFAPSLRQGFVLGAWLTVMLGLSSLRQFNVRDAILTGLLLVIIEIYLRLT